MTQNPHSKFKQPSLAFAVAKPGSSKTTDKDKDKEKSLNQVFRYLSFRWNIPKDRITLRQCREPFEMIRSYEDWTFDKVHSFNYPNEFKVSDLLPPLKKKENKTIQLLYQISPCKLRDTDSNH